MADGRTKREIISTTPYTRSRQPSTAEDVEIQEPGEKKKLQARLQTDRGALYHVLPQCT